MRSIKHFKYVNKKNFEKFLDSYGYTLNDAVGYSFYDKQQYHGNIFTTYVIYLSDHDHIFFKVACFKNFNEYHQSRLGFNGERLLNWYQSANVKVYKVCN